MRKWYVSSIIGLVSAVFIAAPLALAATATPTPAPTGNSGQGLEISPPVLELQANPGQTLTATIRVRNVSAGTLVAHGQADDFGAGTDETGQPKILVNEEGATRYSLKYWVASVPDLTLASQELKTATVTINVPKNAEPGGHFGVVRFTAAPPGLNGTGVALSASVGTLILLRVSGNITDNLSVASFSAGTLDKDQNFTTNSFFEHGPVAFNVRIKNNGSVHEQPVGTIAVTNMFGKNIGSVTVNSTSGNVLPDSIRRFDQSLTKKNLFGHYTAKLNLTYLGGKKTVTATTSFWVIPWRLIGLILILLVAVFFAGRWGIRRYNAAIIAKARR